MQNVAITRLPGNDSQEPKSRTTDNDSLKRQAVYRKEPVEEGDGLCGSIGISLTDTNSGAQTGWVRELFLAPSCSECIEFAEDVTGNLEGFGVLHLRRRPLRGVTTQSQIQKRSRSLGSE